MVRRRPGWPIDRFAEVDRVWSGAVVCLGSGASLVGKAGLVTIELLRQTHAEGRVKVIAVNDSYLLAPWADVLYFADARWWKWQMDGIRRRWVGTAISWTAEQVSQAIKEFAGLKVTIFATGMEVTDPEILMLRNAGEEGLSTDPCSLANGRNGGYQAVNIAILAGGNPIILVGYDGSSVEKLTHWFGDHPIQTAEATVKGYVKHYRTMLPILKRVGVEVLNATPGSSIDAFPRLDLKTALERP